MPPGARSRTVRAAGAALAALLTLAAACRAPERAPVLADLRRPIVFAHRGGSGEGPESTLATMLAALARDPEVAIELDVHRSRDGHLVVIHDDTVDRTTDGHGRVSALTLAELQALDAGHCATPGRGRGTAPPGACAVAGGDFPFRGRGHSIPTLDQVLAALPRETPMMVEVKEAGFEDQLAETLRRSGRLDRLVMGSGRDDTARKLRQALPDALQFFPRASGVRLGAGLVLAGGRLSQPAYQVLATPRAALGARIDSPPCWPRPAAWASWSPSSPSTTRPTSRRWSAPAPAPSSPTTPRAPAG
jgi:glycerophosphoryl diester phosphodiesterase